MWHQEEVDGCMHYAKHTIGGDLGLKAFKFKTQDSFKVRNSKSQRIKGSNCSKFGDIIFSRLFLLHL